MTDRSRHARTRTAVALAIATGLTGWTVTAEPTGENDLGSPASPWRHTLEIGVSLIDQKRTLELSEAQAVRVLDTEHHGPNAAWRAYLPDEPGPAAWVDTLPDGAHTQYVEQEAGLLAIILGFDDERVRVALARHAGNLLWHAYYSVEADLVAHRSAPVEALLNFNAFSAPYVRRIRGVGYGDSREAVHAALGEPDATRTTQAFDLAYEYYFDDDVIIEYRGGPETRRVRKITRPVPAAVLEGSAHPHIHYRESGEPAGRPGSP